MLFTSLSFIVFFTICLLIFYRIKASLQYHVLLLGSCLFIGYFNVLFLLIALSISLFTFYWGRWLAGLQRETTKKRVFISGIIILCLSLVLFKYLGFIEENLQLLLNWCGINWHLPKTTVLFPLGISFYTFQAISYLIDIYWEEEKTKASPVNFLLYMLFFMKFLSGPIERSYDMLPQLQEGKKFNYATTIYGMKLIGIGLMKKVIIADRLAPHLDSVFNAVQDASGLQLLLAGLLYPLQLYTDFSGYTDMAIGGAAMFGLKLSPNFNRPFVATTITDFWRRWHISLSSWVRDYLYSPIAAAKRDWGQGGIIYALLITFTILGIWHGAGWNYMIYGLLQGIFVSYEIFTPTVRERTKKFLGNIFFNVVYILRTYLLFAFSLLFFRLETFTDITYYLKHISFQVNSYYKEFKLGMSDHDLIILGCGIFLMFLYEYFMSKKDLLNALSRQPGIVRWSIYYIIILVIFIFGELGNENFIYLQF